MRPLASSEIRGTWGTVVLPIRPDDQIDYDRLRQEVAVLAMSGVDGIYTNGTAGEFHTQTEAEFDAIHDIVASRCESRQIPFQIGVSHMSPQISLERLRRARSLRPSALQVVLPDWVAPTLEETVAFLSRMGDEAAPIGLVVYNPPGAKKVLSPEEWAVVQSRVPQVVGIKVAGGDSHWYERMKPVLQRCSVFVAGHTLATGVAAGAAGSYSNVACLSPRGAARWYQSMHEAPARSAELERAIRAFFQAHIIPFVTESGYGNAAVDKLLAAIGGWADIGTRLRWPYRWISDTEALRLREIAQRDLPALMSG